MEEQGEHRLLADVFTSMNAGLYATDVHGRVLLINAAGLRLLDRDERGVVGQPMHELVHYQKADGRPLPAERCALLGVLRTGNPARSDDDTFWRGDGTPLSVSWISAPLVENGEVTGAVVVFNDVTRQHVETERLLAEHRAALDAREQLAETNERLALLGRLSKALATLDTDEALQRLARLTVGRVADSCVVDAFDHGAVRRVAVASASPLTEPGLASALRQAPLTSGAMTSLARTVAAGSQQSVARDADQRPGAEPLEREQGELLGSLGCAHALVTPLTVRREVLGAMTWLRVDRDRPFSEADRFLAAEIAARAGAALDNGRLYAQQRTAAETLQRSLLTVLPEPDHLELAARYRPATEGVEVGGDWYDAFLLADGATSIVIGDILGHDMTAAALMGQVRNLLRGIAADRLAPPSVILARLDLALASLGVGALATCLLARVEQTQEQRRAGLRQLRWSSAGHLPPAVVGRDGGVQLLDERGDLMLGVDPGLPRHDVVTTLEPGDTVWLYTDGLVERHDQPLEQGLARLRRTLASVAHLPLTEACDQLLDRMLPEGHPDDVAILALRAHPEDRPRPR